MMRRYALKNFISLHLLVKTNLEEGKALVCLIIIASTLFPSITFPSLDAPKIDIALQGRSRGGGKRVKNKALLQFIRTIKFLSEQSAFTWFYALE